MDKLDVIATFDWMDKEEKVGTLGQDRKSVVWERVFRAV